MGLDIRGDLNDLPADKREIYDRYLLLKKVSNSVRIGSPEYRESNENSLSQRSPEHSTLEAMAEKGYVRSGHIFTKPFIFPRLRLRRTFFTTPQGEMHVDLMQEYVASINAHMQSIYDGSLPTTVEEYEAILRGIEKPDKVTCIESPVDHLVMALIFGKNRAYWPIVTDNPNFFRTNERPGDVLLRQTAFEFDPNVGVTQANNALLKFVFDGIKD